MYSSNSTSTAFKSNLQKNRKILPVVAYCHFVVNAVEFRLGCQPNLQASSCFLADGHASFPA